MGSWRRAEAATPPALRTRLGLVAALAALVVLSLGVLYAGDSTPGAWDARIGTATYDVGPSWRHVALALDFLGEPAGSAALVVAAVAGFLLLRRPRAAVLLVVGAALTVGTATLLKSLVGRTIHGDNLSYPSGHTAFATAVALVVALTAAGRSGLGRTAGLSLVLAAAMAAGAAMGWAQVALGAHYPTDVLGGWCTALAVTPATALVVDRLGDRFGDRPADRAVDGPAEAPADRTADTGRRVGH
ncbi:phosphatase PAP2 family protein [Streptomyces sp. NBC_00659]|uniref:phosphatase PAP2 family protein n=1 Tax=Streptomyces sp. NBC_00659 TaxID=2903669 RepID=UPI002E343ABF|nr:phosphatase PAP2 family protein [Streptomyces sp. NBC_00659]